MKEMKSCPFCGGKATLLHKDGTDYWAVGCTNIQSCPIAPIPFIKCPSEKAAIDAWNTRIEEF